MGTYRPTLSGYLDTIEWNAKFTGVRRVGDLLADPPCSEDEVDRSRASISAANLEFLTNNQNSGTVLVGEPKLSSMPPGNRVSSRGRCFRLRLAQDVADTAHSLDEPRLAALFQRLAHRRDRHRQDV